MPFNAYICHPINQFYTKYTFAVPISVRDYVAGGMFSYTPFGWDLCIFLFCLKFPDYPSPLSFCIYSSGYLVTIFVLCSLSFVDKKNLSLLIYFRFLSRPS